MKAKQDKVEKYGCIGFAIFFAVVSVLVLIGGFVGAVWHFYTAALCGILSGVIYMASKEDRNV